MSDPESGPAADAPPRGVPIYAVEGLVLAAAEAAWLSLPFVTGLGILGSNLFLPPVVAGAVAAALACSVVADNRAPLGAFASLCLTCTVAHAYLLFEAASTRAWAGYYLGPSVLGPPAAAVSLAFLATHSLLALAAIHDRLWAQTLWVEGSLIVVHFLMGAVLGVHARENKPQILGGALLFILAVALGAATALRVGYPKDPAWAWCAAGAALALVVVGWGVALGLGFGGWAYCVVSLALLALLGLRLAGERLREKETTAPPGQQQQQPPPPTAPTAAQSWPRQQAFAGPVLRPRVSFGTLPVTLPSTSSAEALLFSGQPRAARQQNKKAI